MKFNFRIREEFVLEEKGYEENIFQSLINITLYIIISSKYIATSIIFLIAELIHVN